MCQFVVPLRFWFQFRPSFAIEFSRFLCPFGCREANGYAPVKNTLGAHQVSSRPWNSRGSIIQTMVLWEGHGGRRIWHRNGGALVLARRSPRRRGTVATFLSSFASFNGDSMLVVAVLLFPKAVGLRDLRTHGALRALRCVRAQPSWMHLTIGSFVQSRMYCQQLACAWNTSARSGTAGKSATPGASRLSLQVSHVA